MKGNFAHCHPASGTRLTMSKSYWICLTFSQIDMGRCVLSRAWGLSSPLGVVSIEAVWHLVELGSYV